MHDISHVIKDLCLRHVSKNKRNGSKNLENCREKQKTLLLGTTALYKMCVSVLKRKRNKYKKEKLSTVTVDRC